jgi:ABC-type multidrug transport system fused ATPase/permease subunit
MKKASKESDVKKLTLKESLKISLWSLKVSWKISKLATIGRLFSEIFVGLDGFISVYIMSLIIDKSISAVSSGSASLDSVIPLFLFLLIYSIFMLIVRKIQRYSRRIMKITSNNEIERMRFEKIHSLGVQSLEDPDLNNKLQKMTTWMGDIPYVYTEIVIAIAALVKSILTGIVLLNALPILVPILIVAALIAFYQDQAMFKREFEWQVSDKHMEEKRNHWFSVKYLTDPVTLSEISVTGSYGYLSERYKKFFDYYNNGFRKIFKLDFITGIFVEIIQSFLIFYGYIQTFSLLLSNLITVGNVTLYMSAIRNFHAGLAWFASEIVFIRDLIVKIREVYEVFNMEPKVADGDYELERFINPPKVEFKDVTFRYPNTDNNILENFNLVIEPGEKIAIVGENGAGKSTMVKLLCRLYDPNEGTILINGRDLKDIKIDDWYKNIGALFQEFNFYANLTAEENIYMGRAMKKKDKDGIVEAAKNAEAHDFIMKYKNQYKTIMSERFPEGIRPSKGQKQKIAIARFFYRNAPFAIFDEPTSAIDAQAEYRIFDRIYNFFGNKSVIIISHRFSTVRSADRILVLDKGKIVEEGTHQELLKMEGLYADSFKKQAEGYL